jgi:hypothetical protein
MAKEYVFLDEWDVDAPQEAVFNALADARTYPEWWKPVYIDVEGDEPPGQGVTTKQHFKGKLPYTLGRPRRSSSSTRTPTSRSRSSGTSPAPVSGRWRRTATARSTFASTGSSMPTAPSSAI